MKKKKTILFTALNMAGHLNGCYALAEHLEKLGCRCVLATVGSINLKIRGYIEPKFETFIIEDTRCTETIVIDPKTGEETLTPKSNKDTYASAVETIIDMWAEKSRLDSLVAVMDYAQKLAVNESELFKDKFEQIIKQVEPDLIVVDRYAPPLSVINGTLPWVVFHPANPLGLVKQADPGQQIPLPFMGSAIYSKLERMNMRTNNPEKWKAIVDTWTLERQEFEEKFPKAKSPWNIYAYTNNLPLIEPSTLIMPSKILNIYMYPMDLDYDQDDDLFKYSAESINCETFLTLQSIKTDRSIVEEWTIKIEKLRQMTPENKKKKLVYFSLGSIGSASVKLMKRLVAFLANDHKHIYIVSKGLNGDKYELNASNMIGANYVPQLCILQLVDAAIIHGGNNTITESLFLGVPAVVCPLFADQLDNAQRFEDLKLGYSLNPYDCSEEKLLKAVYDVVENKTLRNKINKISIGMRQRKNGNKVARKLFRLIESKKKKQNKSSISFSKKSLRF